MVGDIAALLVVLGVFAALCMLAHAIVSLGEWLGQVQARRRRRQQARRLVHQLHAVGAEVLLRGRKR